MISAESCWAAAELRIATANESAQSAETFAQASRSTHLRLAETLQSEAMETVSYLETRQLMLEHAVTEATDWTRAGSEALNACLDGLAIHRVAQTPPEGEALNIGMRN